MKQLPGVTLIAYDNSDDVTATLSTLSRSCQYFDFAEVVLVSRITRLNVFWPFRPHLTIIPTVHSGYAAAMYWEVAQIGSCVNTPWALFVSADGRINTPTAWKDEWLQYDFIGAPWPPSVVSDPRYRVGNTGFCLKSQKFMSASRDLSDKYQIESNYPGDVFTCQDSRPEMEALGVKYAPVSVAADFSWEYNIPEYPEGRPDAFGIHGFINNRDAFL